MKGKTVGLIEFLADGASGPGAGQTVVTRKSTNWADDVENEDGRYLSFIHRDFFLRWCKFLLWTTYFGQR